jgi:DNA polymerase III delta prime subunit
MTISDSPWVEKYKPQKLEDVIGDPLMLAKFKEFIDNKTLQHLLFCGRPGTGKSTCAKLIAKSITNEGNILYINASQEKGVDTIRNKVDSFCSMAAFGGLRVVIFDEFDGMTWQAMETMRNTMEEYIDNSRFILTCNWEKKISEPIKSRCQMFTFKADEKTQKVATIRRCMEILKAENITSNNLKPDLIKLINRYYPDIRRTINALQKLTVGGTFQYKDELEGDAVENKLIECIKNMDIKTIRQEIVGNADYNDLYKILFNRAADIKFEKKLNIMLLVGDAARWHSIVLDPEINFVTCIIGICKELCAE